MGISKAHSTPLGVDDACSDPGAHSMRTQAYSQFVFIISTNHGYENDGASFPLGVMASRPTPVPGLGAVAAVSLTGLLVGVAIRSS